MNPDPSAPAVAAKFQEAWAQHQRGQLGPAWKLYQEVISADPNHFDALHLAGLIAAQARFFDQAVDLISRAVAVDPRNAAAHFNLGNARADFGQDEAAVAAYDAALALAPREAEIHNNKGNALWRLKRFEAALASYDAAIAANPAYAQAHNNKGNALRDLGRAEEALASYAAALRLNPAYAEPHNNTGNVLKDQGKLDDALAAYARAIALKPDFAEAFNNKGNALRALERFDAAVEAYGRALALKPDFADAHYNLGATLRLMKRPLEALASHTEAIRLRPDHAETFNARGLARADMKDPVAAVADYDEAIRLKPDFAEAYNNKGVALADQRRHAEALKCYDKAIALKANAAEAYCNRGVALKEMGQEAAALMSYDTAIILKPESAEAYNNKGILLADQHRHVEAIATYAKALALKPDYPFLAGTLLQTRMRICDWTDFDKHLAALLADVAAGKPATPPFQLLSLADTPELHKKAAARWTNSEYPRNDALGPIPRYPTHPRLRVGYFSMDFKNHPVGMLTAGMIEAHDKTKIETYGFSYGPDTGDPIRKRLEKAFDTFFDVRSFADADIARIAREVELDIAIDLAGCTNDARTAAIFALGAAPLQVNYLGYPGTMGADYYDYILADAIVAPNPAHFSEAVVALPGCYQANDTQRIVADRTFTRAELGLPEKGFVFCCFNNAIKITPHVFDAWMRILTAVPGSVLWLLEDNKTTAANLRAEAAKRGVAPERIVFAARVTNAEHMARHTAADLFLDTLPYNAHTTASDALWMGLPLLTCRGSSFAARVAASILAAMGLDELITTDLNAYEALAIALAKDPVRLAALREKTVRARSASDVFKPAVFARRLEKAFEIMAQRQRIGQNPVQIMVDP